MTRARIHVEQDLRIGATIKLTRDQAHYLHRVLRLGEGDAIRVFNGHDGEFNARVDTVRGANASVTLEDASDTQTESPLVTCLVQGLCRSQRMDYCVQKASELGVTRILPVRTERCVVRLDERRARKRLAHWQAVAISACEQSGRTRVPTIEMPIGFEALLMRDDLPGPALLDPDQGARVRSWAFNGEALSLLVGPEGGFTQTETSRLVEMGAARWRMGPRVLRTETAGVVALALAQAKWGDLG